MPPLLSRISSSFGHAVGSFQHAVRSARDGNDYQRAALVGAMATQAQWDGGTWVRESSERRAMASTWVYTAVGMIARELAAASAEIEVVRHTDDNDEPVKIVNHPLLKLLRRPNPWMGRSFFWQYTAWWLQLDGNAYWFAGVGQNDRRTVYELWPLPSHRVEPMPGDTSQFVKEYEFAAKGQIYKIPAEYVIHFQLPNPFDPFRGLSPLSAAMLAVDSDIAMARWNGSFFGKNNTMPSAIINLSSGDPARAINPGDVESLKEDLRIDYAAAERRTLVTTANSVTVNPLGWNPREMDFIEGRKVTREEIFNIYGVPLGLMSENATEANAQTGDRVFKEKTIWPLTGLLAEQMSAELVAPFYGDDDEARYNDFRPTDKSMELQEIGAAQGVLSVDEIRQKFYHVKPWKKAWSQDVPASLAGTLLSMESADPSVPTTDNLNPPPTDNTLPTPDNPPQLPSPSEPSTPTIDQTIPTDAAPASTPDMTVKDARPYAGDLRLWRRKELERAKDGRALSLKFVPNVVIDPTCYDDVLTGLAIAQNETDPVVRVLAVKTAFRTEPWKASPRPWSLFEQRLNAVIKAILGNEAQRITLAMQGQGANAIESDALWQEHRDRLLAAIQPEIENLARFGVHNVTAAIAANKRLPTVNVNWNLVNTQAVAWAKQYAYTLVTDLTTTSRTTLQKTVSKWITDGKPLSELISRIGAITEPDAKLGVVSPFNPVRARAIAVTEATRAYAQANNEAFTAAGVLPASFIPPGHVHCRCFIQPYELPDGTFVSTWYTVKDDWVCEDIITTPWGNRNGCKSMHRVVVSDGEYGGLSLDKAIIKANRKK